MITLRRAMERHHVRRRKQEVWLTFFPQDRTDPLADGFGALETLDESRLSPGAIVAPRLRHEAEIVTHVLAGSLAQGDSTGWSGVIHAGEFQRMTTGRSVRHSERNASQTDRVHIFQMSLRPCESDLDCAHEQRLFSMAERRGVLCVVASPDGRRGSLRVHEDALIYSAMLDVGQHLVHELPQGRLAWLHVVRGEIVLGDLVLATGDGVGVAAELAVSFTAREKTEILLLDLREN
ncbi:MAG: pirin family protein [Deltaproteobacteria bacterium]|nr:pirin family protein [Deltaproteobacteria bacterium]